jgi:hypothetical protein
MIITKKYMTGKFPIIKKKIIDYLTDEDAKITKEKAIGIGAIVASSLAVQTVNASSCPNHSQNTHANSDTCIQQDRGILEATHKHHSNHCNHSSY